jgi:hypothetical protein
MYVLAPSPALRLIFSGRALDAKNGIPRCACMVARSRLETGAMVDVWTAHPSQMGRIMHEKTCKKNEWS